MKRTVSQWSITTATAWLTDWRRIAGFFTCAVLLALPPFLAGGFVLSLLTTGFYYTIMAASWNLLAGFTGQFSLAQQAFAAIGAYGSGLAVKYWGAPLWLSIPAGVAAAALLGYGLGRPPTGSLPPQRLHVASLTASWQGSNSMQRKLISHCEKRRPLGLAKSAAAESSGRLRDVTVTCFQAVATFHQ